MLLVISVGMSAALLVPINSRVAPGGPLAATRGYRQQLRRWDRTHYARVAFFIAAFVLSIIAAT